MGLKKINIVVFLIVVVLLAFSSLYRVWEFKQVVITKFGKPVAVVTDPGLHYRIPFIHKVNVFEKRLLDYDSPPTEILTLDKKNLRLDNYAKWQIVDPLKFMQAVHNELGAQARLDDIIYSELRTELGRHELIDIISIKREQIMETVTAESDEKAKEYGISVKDVRIKRADLPQENEQAIFARMEAERKRIANQYRSEGEEESLKITAETDKQAVIILAEAEKTAQQVRGEGDSEAARIYAQAYGKNERFYSLMRSLEAYEKAIDSTTTLILSPDSKFFEYFQNGP